MTSGKFGVEREVLQLLDIKRLSVVLPGNLSQAERTLINRAANGFIGDKPDRQEIDRTVQQIYGLGPLDAEAVADALSTRSPFPAAKKLACAPVLPKWTERFCTRLQKELFSDHTNLPWKFIAVSLDAQALPTAPPVNWIEHADDLAVSRITSIDAQRPLIVIGLLDRSRYWIPTQPRLLASDIIWEHGSMLEERTKR